ncbi:DUF4347 domain-containing protein [Stieleria varia]|nr:DUF4347 domain-containing protein [Stieleria varia]
MSRKSARRRVSGPQWSLAKLEPRVLLAGDVGAAAAPPAEVTPMQTSEPESVGVEAVASAQSNVVVFVDPSAGDLLSVATPVAKGATLVMLDGERDGVSQIREQLALLSRGESTIQQVHLVTHGASGRLQLGASELSLDTLDRSAADLAGWADSLASDADILLYGCDVAGDADGREFVRRIATLTGADVAASDDRTANAAQQGDWQLEYHVGEVNAFLALTADAMRQFQGHLAIEIRAAGTVGGEELQVHIGDQFVTTLTMGNTGAFERNFQTYTINYDNADVSQIRLNYSNDFYDPQSGLDRNIGVDWIRVDGVQYETESPNVFAAGVYANGQISAGNLQTEYLSSNGFFDYGGSSVIPNGSFVQIFASGDEGVEQMRLLVDGRWVAIYDNVPTQGGVFSYQSDQVLTPDRIRVEFTNDFYDPAFGFDGNLNVDRIEIDGVAYESEAPNVFSTGGYLPEYGNAHGYFYTEKLQTSGYFQYGGGGGPVDPPTSQSGLISLAETQVTVNENTGVASIRLRRTDGASGAAAVYFQTQDGSAVNGVDYFGTDSGVVYFADGQTAATIDITLIDNANADGEKTFGVSLFHVDGAVQGEPRTAGITIVDNESNDGLIGYWNLNDANANGFVADSSGLGNNGIARNFAAPSGPINLTPNTNFDNPGAYRFDGVNDYVEVAENESLRLTEGTYSQSAWIRPTSYDDGYHGVIGYQQGTSVGTRYPFIYVRNDAIYAGFGTGGNTWKGVVADNVITINAWNHVAVSFDGTTMQLFVNGEVVATNSNFGGSAPPTTFAQLNIGRINNQFIGDIDEVRMYDRAISGAEVSALIGGATLPPPRVAGYFTRNVITAGLTQPTTIEPLPDGRFLVAERAGIVRIVNADGSLSGQPVLDIQDIVNTVGVDRGLMSIAVGPDFAQTRQLYVAYTYDPPEVNAFTGNGGADGEGGRVARVSRFTLNESWTVADRNSEVVVLGTNSTYQNIGQPNRHPLLSDPQSGIDANGNYIEDFIASDELSHTVGNLEFGPDGALYVSTGDGGSYGRVDPVNLRALDVNSLNGKILRVDPLTGKGLPDNPFWNGNPNSNQSRVYSLGLRNPFRFAINPNSGEVFIADVGWLNYEEINTGRGKNFGWPAYEGYGLTGGDRGSYSSLQATRDFLATNPEITAPIWVRSHSSGARAIIMGDFIQGGNYPASLQGAFLFLDIGDQVIRAGRVDANGQLIDVVPVSSAIGFITDITRLPDGTLVYADLASGTIGRLVFNG